MQLSKEFAEYMEKVLPDPWVMKEGKGDISCLDGTEYVPIFINDTAEMAPLALLPPIIQ